MSLGLRVWNAGETGWYNPREEFRRLGGDGDVYIYMIMMMIHDYDDGS